MAALRNALLLLMMTTLVVSPLLVSALDFDVGNEEGWVVPKSDDESVYNRWASKNRFQIGDTIRFKYKKDSVMEVTEEEYEHCKSPHPSFFSNSGDTVFKLDHSGTFYFISGVTGHCEKGQKMIIKVLAQPGAPEGSPAAANQTGSTLPAPPSGSSSAAPGAVVSSAMGIVGLLFGSLFFHFF